MALKLSEKNLSLLEKLCLIPSAPGFERDVQEVLINIYEGLGIKKGNNLKERRNLYGKDNLGNLYLKLPGNPDLPRVAFLAHADSPAFLVESVSEDKIYASARPIGWEGSIDKRLWAGRPIMVVTEKGFYSGNFTTKSVHLQKDGEEDTTQDHEDIRVDLGTTPRYNLKKICVKQGTPVFFKPEFVTLLDPNFVQGTNLDNRAGTLSLIELANRFIKKEDHRGDVYLVSTVSEEADPQGNQLVSITLYQSVDLAIAIDTTVSVDNFQGDRDNTYALYGFCNKVDEGFALKRNGFNREVTDFITEVARANNIKLQLEADREHGQTDELSLKMLGVSTAAFLIPTRNLHSPVETLSTRDIQRAIEISEKTVYEVAKNEGLKKHFGEIIRPSQ